MNRPRIIAIAFLTLVAIVAAFFCVARYRPIDADISTAESIIVDAETRYYRLVVPRTLASDAPVVFAFHGTGGSSESMAAYSRLDRMAVDNGFPDMVGIPD